MIDIHSAPCPAHPLYVVGDIHGRIDLLDEVLDRIATDITAQGPEAEGPARLVFLGDYIDRTGEGGAVVALLSALQGDAPEDVVCLMGNHERMVLDALDDPQARFGRWLRHGGQQTCVGLGLGDVPTDPGPDEAHRLAERLRAALPDGSEAWLRALPLWYRSGDVLCVHAAMDPDLSPRDQQAQTMLWDGCKAFHQRPRPDGLWVVHGHTVVPDPAVRDRRISVDTGAYFSDRLTAAALGPGRAPRFLQTSS